MNHLPGEKEMPHYVKSVRLQTAWNIQPGIMTCILHVVNIATGEPLVDLILKKVKGEQILDDSTGMRFWRSHVPSPWGRWMLSLVLAAKTGNTEGFSTEVSALGMPLIPGPDPSPTTCPPPTYVEAMGTPAALWPLTIPIHLVGLDSSVISNDGLP